MKFYIYSQPVFSERKKERTCLLLKVSEALIPELDEQSIRRVTLVRNETYFKRLVDMLSYGGDTGDGWYVVDHNRTEKDIVDYMDTRKIK